MSVLERQATDIKQNHKNWIQQITNDYRCHIQYELLVKPTNKNIFTQAISISIHAAFNTSSWILDYYLRS